MGFEFIVKGCDAAVHLTPLSTHIRYEDYCPATEGGLFFVSFNVKPDLELTTTLRNGKAALQEDRPQLVDQSSPFRDEAVTRTVEGLHDDVDT